MASRFLFVATLCVGLVGPFAACGSESEGDGGSGPSTSSTGGGGSSSSSSASASSSSASSSSGGQTLTCPFTSNPYETLGGNGEPETDPACSLLAQDCPNPGEACEPKSVGGVFKAQCVYGDGLKAAAEPCSSNAECQGGLYCVFGLCSPVCCPETDEPCQGGTCNVEYSGDNNQYGADKYIRLCSFLVQCQLLTVDACAEGTECHVQGDTGLALCIPPNGANVPEGGACTYINDCGDMQHCSNTGTCRYYCRVSDGGDAEVGLGGCPDGQTCTNADFGIADIGICQPT